MVVIAPPPSLSPPSEQAMTESSRGAPLHVPTTSPNAITHTTASVSTSTPINNASGASTSHFNNHYTAAQAQYSGIHAHAAYVNTRKTRPYSQYTNGIPALRNNQHIYPTLTPPTNGNPGLLTTATHHHHNHNHNNGHLYHHCTFPCSATSVLTGGDAALPTRFSFGPGFEPQQLFGVGQYGTRASAAVGSGTTPRLPQQQQQQANNQQHQGTPGSSNHQEHIVLFHVNPGVTIRFQIGENLEVLRGPVTVPMVSTNSTPPIAMPIQVPVGHMVQQIVDERGTLRHVILSPTHPANLVPMPHQHFTDGTTGTNGLTTSTSTTTSSGGGTHHPTAASAGQQQQPPPPASVGGYPHHHHHHHHYGPTPPPPNQQPNSGGGAAGGLSPSPGYGPPHGPHHHHNSPHYHTNMPPPPGGGGGVQGEIPGQFYNKDERTQRQYIKLRKKLNDKRKGGSGAGGGGGGGGTNSSSSSTSSSSGVGGMGSSQSSQQAAPMQRLRHTGGMVMLVKEKVGGMNSVGTSEDGEESSSVQEDDDTILADMLSSVQAPTVSELSSRSALLQWAIPPAIVDHNSTLTSLASCNASTSSGLSTAGSSTASSLSPASSVVTSAAAASPVTTLGSISSTVDLPEINEARLRYEVLLSDGDKGRRFKSIYSGRSLSCRIQDLRPGQEYTVCLQVHLEELRGTATDPIRFTTPACEPDQPLPPQLNARKKNSLQLRWSAPDNDNGSHIIHYILEVTPSTSPTSPTLTNSLPPSPSSTFTEVYCGKSRTYNLQKLTPSTPYRFRLCAVNGLGSSLWSDVVCFRTLEPAPLAPVAPKLLEANVHEMKLRWERRDGMDGLFTLEMECDSVRYMPVYNGEGTEFHLRDLTASTEYKFRLCASNDGGCSPWSEEARYSTRPAAPNAPAKPTVRGRIGAHSFRLGWEAPHKTGGAPVTEYTVELNSGSGFETIYSGPATDTACTSLSPGTTYQARISCSSLGGRSTFSDLCTVTTDAVAPNACPAPVPKGGQSNVTAATKPATDRYVILTLQPSDYNGGAPVLEYEVEMGRCAAGCGESDGVAINERNIVYKGKELECLVANLLPGTSYSFTSRAINRIGGGAWSSPVTLTTAAAVPDAPTQLTGVCRTAHSAQLEWRVPEANGAPITEYRLEYSMQADFTLPEATTVTTVPFSGSAARGSCISHEIRGLIPFTTYYFRLSALNSTGASHPSPCLTLVTPASTPAIPSQLRCEPSPTTLFITWLPPACHGSSITHYNVDVADVTYTTATAEPELLVEELAPETVYRVRVQACNSVGCGGYSGLLKTATLKMPPDAPKVECVGTAWNSLKLKWGEGKNQDYTTYHLELLNPFTRDYQCVFRGTAYTCKVNKLHEQTRYRFRICAANDAGRGPWSEEDWEFETAVAPPAAVRIPRVMEMDVEQRLCTLEWTASKGQAGDTVLYLLQLAVPGLSSGTKKRGGADKEQKADQMEFKEIYRGPETRYTITHFDIHFEHHARVCPVRICANGELLTGIHSPVLTFCAPTAMPPGSLDPMTSSVATANTSMTLTLKMGANAGGASARGSGGKSGSSMQRQPVMRRLREVAKTFAESYKVGLLTCLVVCISVLLAMIMYIAVNE